MDLRKKCALENSYSEEEVELILVVAEALSNEFGKRRDMIGKAIRIFNIMKLGKTPAEIQAARIEDELREM